MQHLNRQLIPAALLALACSGCGNGESKKHSDAPAGPTTPSVNSIAPSFTNTAKDGKEVADRIDAVTTKLSASSLSLTDTRRGRIKALNALPPQPMPNMPTENEGANGIQLDPLEGLQPGGDCLEVAGQFDMAYKNAVDGLKKTADAIRTWDQQPLPDGVVRNAPSDRFAVSYTVDVGKMAPKQESPSPDDANGLPSLQNVTGSFTFGIGANTKEVGAEVEGQLQATGTDSNGGVKLGLAIYADETNALLKIKAFFDLQATDKGQSGAGAGKLELTLAGDANPGINLLADLQGAAPGKDGRPEAINANFTMNVSKVEASALEVKFASTVNGQSESHVAKLAADPHGQCVVQSYQ